MYDHLAELVGNVESWIKANRIQILCGSPAESAKRLLSGVRSADIRGARAAGGFNNRVLLISLTDRDIVFSVDKPLKSSAFYSFMDEQIEETSGGYGVINAGANRLEDTVAVDLISLAKQDVYTFPRFALGVSYIANAVRNRFNADVTLHDLQLMDVSGILDALGRSGSEIIGISMTFGLFEVLEELIPQIQAIKPAAAIVVGGSLAAISYAEILEKYPGVIIALGEGEKSMPQIIEYHKGRLSLDEVENIAYRDGQGRVVVTENKRCYNDETFLPELDLLIPTLREKGVIQLEMSRGCYNACSFCPRRNKGDWRQVIRDVPELDYFLDIYCGLLKDNDYRHEDMILYIVDEEFIGGNNPGHRRRSEDVSALFRKRNIRFETSFRMSAIYIENASDEERNAKIENVRNIHLSGLNRVLVGVESGIDSVLTRFNKNVTAAENVRGVRLLTALGVPVRFTYITFDPSMDMNELIDTYMFQGRKDLVMKQVPRGSAVFSRADSFGDNDWLEFSADIPFYFTVPYMLVSLECLIGSQYYANLKESGRLEGSAVMALGKRNPVYSDWRIGMMSQYAQLWIDKNFTLDYTLKSLAKIYPPGKSGEIRDIRTRLKYNSYNLLGKMIYCACGDARVLPRLPAEDREYAEALAQTDPAACEERYGDILQYLLDYQIEVLVSEMDGAAHEIKRAMKDDDFELYMCQFEKWKESRGWQLLNAR